MGLGELFGQAVKFLGVGIVSTMLDWSIFALTFKVLNFYYAPALMLAFASGAVVNYLMNKKLTFQNKSKHPFQPMIFGVIACLMLILSLALMSYMIKIMDAIIARMIITGVVFVCNFIFHKLITFGRLFDERRREG